MDRTFVALLLMKSMTSTAGDMPKSTSTWPESRITPPGAVGHAWTTPCCSRFLVVYDMTRANLAETFPPSPKNPWLKFPEFRANVVSPRAHDCRSPFLPAHPVRG